MLTYVNGPLRRNAVLLITFQAAQGWLQTDCLATSNMPDEFEAFSPPPTDPEMTPAAAAAAAASSANWTHENDILEG